MKGSTGRLKFLKFNWHFIAINVLAKANRHCLLVLASTLIDNKISVKFQKFLWYNQETILFAR